MIRKCFFLSLLLILSVVSASALPVSSAENASPNNTSITLPPNLMIGDITIPQSATMGFTLDGAITVINAGPSEGKDVMINFYLTKNGTNGTPIWFNQKSSSRIPRFYKEIVPFSAKVPTGIPAGFYQVLVTIGSTDPGSPALHQNISASSIYLSPGTNTNLSGYPDLSMTIDSVSPSEVTPGRPLTINYTMRNTGTESSGQYYIGFYLSPDQEITPADYELWDQIYYKSYPGMIEKGTTTNVVPETIPPGTYYLGAIIDVTSSVAEQNKDNNQAIYRDQFLVTSEQQIDSRQFSNEVAGYITLKTNLYRNFRGLPNLTFDAELSHLALAHSMDMAKRGYFSHYTPEGLDPTGRAERVGYQVTKQLPNGTSRSGIAENIVKIAEGYAVGSGYSGFVDPTDPQAVADAMLIEWINSPEHNENLIDPTVSRIGAGIASDGEFFYGTQNFF